MKKNRYKVDKSIVAKNSSWTFSGNVAKNFDKHIDKSVPLYGWSHDLGLKISDFFVKKNSKIHDLGCSRAEHLTPGALQAVEPSVRIG